MAGRKVILELDEDYLDRIKTNPYDFGELLKHACTEDDEVRKKILSKYGLRVVSTLIPGADREVYLFNGGGLLEMNPESPEMVDLLEHNAQKIGGLVSVVRNKMNILGNKVEERKAITHSKRYYH